MAGGLCGDSQGRPDKGMPGGMEAGVARGSGTGTGEGLGKVAGMAGGWAGGDTSGTSSPPRTLSLSLRESACDLQKEAASGFLAPFIMAMASSSSATTCALPLARVPSVAARTRPTSDPDPSVP